METTQLLPPERLVNMTETCSMVGLSRTKIWQLTKDGLFPQMVQVEGTRKAYVLSEIQAWISKKIAARDQGGED